MTSKRIFTSLSHHLSLTLMIIMSTLSFSVVNTVQARKPGVVGESEVTSKQFDAAVTKLTALDVKNADEWYLLGQAYMGLGQKKDAHNAWTEALHINENLSKRKKWTFLFPPNKPLKGKQKKRLKEDFEDNYKELNAIVSRLKKTQTRELKNKASRTRIDAKKKDAKEEQYNKMALAKTKSIDSKQRMADRKARSNQRKRRKTPRRSGSNSWIGTAFFGVILGLIIFAVIFGKRRSSGRSRAQYYDVGYDDETFMSGPFYYRGRHYRSHDLFYRDHGYYYTNQMYRDGYDRWGSGQAYDEALDHEIHHDIDEREDLYNAAAQEGYEADVMRADADHYEQDARELEHEAADGNEAAGFFDDGHDFEDDEFADDESYSDGDDGGFEDDYDDGGYDDGGFEDDYDA